MRYFIDTEFIETGTDRRPSIDLISIDLISIGVVCEDGREYYAISNEFQGAYASDWVVKNVIDPLPEMGTPFWKDRAVIRQDLLSFIGLPPDTNRPFDKPEFWGYYADYDWVVFCWMFGNMIDLPKSWPKYCRDLKQMADMCGGIKFPKQKDGEHNALEDAKWNKDMYGYLRVESQTFMDLVDHEQTSRKS